LYILFFLYFVHSIPFSNLSLSTDSYLLQ
jgi:hypothetical protein